MKPEVHIVKSNTEEYHIALTGDLTVRNHPELHKIFQSMISSLADKKNVLIQLPEGVDLCLLQLLAAVKQHEETNGRKITVTALLTDEHQHLLTKTGWLAFLNTTKLNNTI